MTTSVTVKANPAPPNYSVKVGIVDVLGTASEYVMAPGAEHTFNIHGEAVLEVFEIESMIIHSAAE